MNCRSILQTLCVAGLATSLCVAAEAAPVIDQDQPVFDIISGTTLPLPMGRFDQESLAQSFTQTANNIAGAGIFLSDDGATGEGQQFSQEITLSV